MGVIGEPQRLPIVRRACTSGHTHKAAQLQPEREAVVLWLYALEYGLALEGNPAAATIRAAAEMIERGDHLIGDGSGAPKPLENDPPKTPSGA